MGQLFKPKHKFKSQITNITLIGQIIFVKKSVDIFKKFCRYFREKKFVIISK